MVTTWPHTAAVSSATRTHSWQTKVYRSSPTATLKGRSTMSGVSQLPTFTNAISLSTPLAVASPHNPDPLLRSLAVMCSTLVW